MQGDKFEFTLAPNCDPGTVLLRLTLTDHLGPVEVQLLDVVPPAQAENMTSFGSTSWIRLEWAQTIGVDTKGFDVWRSPSPGGRSSASTSTRWMEARSTRTATSSRSPATTIRS